MLMEIATATMGSIGTQLPMAASATVPKSQTSSATDNCWMSVNVMTDFTGTTSSVGGSAISKTSQTAVLSISQIVFASLVISGLMIPVNSFVKICLMQQVTTKQMIRYAPVLMAIFGEMSDVK